MTPPLLWVPHTVGCRVLEDGCEGHFPCITQPITNPGHTVISVVFPPCPPFLSHTTTQAPFPWTVGIGVGSGVVRVTSIECPLKLVQVAKEGSAAMTLVWGQGAWHYPTLGRLNCATFSGGSKQSTALHPQSLWRHANQGSLNFRAGFARPTCPDLGGAGMWEMGEE